MLYNSEYKDTAVLDGQLLNGINKQVDRSVAAGRSTRFYGKYGGDKGHAYEKPQKKLPKVLSHNRITSL